MKSIYAGFRSGETPGAWNEVGCKQASEDDDASDADHENLNSRGRHVEVSSAGENILDLLAQAWFNSVCDSTRCMRTQMQQILFKQWNPLSQWRNRSIVPESSWEMQRPIKYLATHQWASLSVTRWSAEGKQKTVGQTCEDLENHRQPRRSRPPPMHTSLSCTNTTPSGAVMLSRVIIVIRTGDTKDTHTGTHSLFKPKTPNQNTDRLPPEPKPFLWLAAQNTEGNNCKQDNSKICVNCANKSWDYVCNVGTQQRQLFVGEHLNNFVFWDGFVWFAIF